jgi:hypothetical protein
LLGVLFNGVCQGFITCLKLVKEEQNIEQKNKRNLEEQKTTWTLRQMGLLIIEDIGILATSPSCPIHIGVISHIWFITHGKSVKKSSFEDIKNINKVVGVIIRRSLLSRQNTLRQPNGWLV